jgi:hypothetical protein
VQRDPETDRGVLLFTVLGAESLDESHPAHLYFEKRTKMLRTQFAVYMDDWFSDPDDKAIDFMSYLDGLQLAWLRDASIDLRGHAIAFMQRLLESDSAHTR